MQNYDVAVLLPKEEKDGIDVVKKLADKSGGRVDEVVEWGAKTLTFPIKKQKEALFFLLKVSFSPSTVPQFEKELRVNDKIMRHLIVKTNKKVKVESLPKKKETIVKKPKETKKVKTNTKSTEKK
ncbi:30S ribosomal protein S6 [Candidatus Microgenomates bacterium]|nr:30S ribosomal protein S6 [Candidatus Microgenomates bacterium]